MKRLGREMETVVQLPTVSTAKVLHPAGMSLRRPATRLAATTDTDIRTAVKWLKGERVWDKHAEAYERAARELGIERPQVAAAQPTKD